MHKRYVFGICILVTSISFLFGGSAHALGSSNIVISQVQLGSVASASNEFIELYNTDSNDTEITNWCLYYASASTTTNGSKLTCFVPANDLTHLYLPAHAYAFVVSTQLLTTFPVLASDIRFAATLSGTAGHVRLIDMDGRVIDKLAWGTTALSPEGFVAARVPQNGAVLQRVSVDGVYQDTDSNSSDFELSMPRSAYSYGAIYEVQDLCYNLSGIQVSLPDGYTADGSATCLPPPVDVCTNIDGLQVAIPDGFVFDSQGDCQVDVCLNIDDLQRVVPDFYRIDGTDCILNLPHIEIAELLPNAIGSDVGNEFIELYNPNEFDVDLSLYRMQVGTNTLKTYAFPLGSLLAAGTHKSFSNDDIAFTLVNASSQVRLIMVDGQTIDDSPIYEQAYDGMAWASIDGKWQYTDQPTPGAPNVPSHPIEIVEDAVTGLKPCAANQYRNPDTNRCRLVLTIMSTVTPCKDGQYRSEMTNRCRSLDTDIASLVPCAEGQERNPLTNRCRSLAAAAIQLSPCKDGQERNIDTNRCRTVTKLADVGYAVQPIAKSDGNGSGLIALAVIIGLALAYALWEWRVELVQLFVHLRSFLHHPK